MSLVELLKVKYDLNDKEDLSRVLAIFKHCAASRGEDVPSGYPKVCDEVQMLSFPWDSEVSLPSGSDLVAEHIDCYENMIELQFTVADEDEKDLVHYYEEHPESCQESSESEGQTVSFKEEPIRQDRMEDVHFQDTKVDMRDARYQEIGRLYQDDKR